MSELTGPIVKKSPKKMVYRAGIIILLIIAIIAGSIWIVDYINRPVRLQGHSDAVYGVAFSPDGKTLASASGDKTIRLWNLSSQK